MRELQKIKVTMDELDELWRCLHDQSEGAAGGPLHVVTDDGNLRDSDIVGCYKDTEEESDVVVKTICKEILHRLLLLTEPQRLVWWLRARITLLKIDPATLAEEVRDGRVDPQTNGAYDARIWLGEKCVWIGLEQQEALSSRVPPDPNGGS
jgi:hypothetical protein